MKAKELRQKSKEELRLLLKENREKLRQFKFDLKSKKLKKTDQLGELRKDTARILTILKERGNKK